jgi:YD repeat-containing protein
LQLISQKAGTASPYTNRMDLSYTYSATTAGQFGVGTTAGNAGQLLGVSGTINGATESAAYTYDNVGRLVTSSQTSNGTSAQRRFAYDRWGNRTGVWDATSGGTPIQSLSLQSVSFPGTGSAPTNRLSSVTAGGSTSSYSYDANGNVTNDGAHSYTYDSDNRLVSVAPARRPPTPTTTATAATRKPSAAPSRITSGKAIRSSPSITAAPARGAWII